MTTKDEALDKALEALENCTTWHLTREQFDKNVTAINAIKQSRSAPVQEPVAWQVHPFDYGIGHQGVYARTDRPEQVEMWKRKGWTVQPLYTAQPVQEFVCSTGLCHYKSQREWVGLTDEDFENAFQETYIMGDSDLKDFSQVIEAKLKEKNNGKEVGKLDFNGPKMVFTGDAEESAKVFIDLIGKWFVGRLEEERKAEREACAVIAETPISGEQDDITMQAKDRVAAAIRARGENT